MALSRRDRDSLRYAKTLLEHPGLAARIAGLIGTPMEKGYKYLPARWSDMVTKATRIALQKALDLAAVTMTDNGAVPSADPFHKIIVAVTGAGG
ncbi:MAG TPA: EcsC family protein, partial [Desulfomonilia bacterium]|nr:EcsC family protein [Desulfomonilia bacterium]